MGKLLAIGAAIGAVMGIAYFVSRKEETNLNSAEGQREAGNPLFNPGNFARNEVAPTPNIKEPDNTRIKVGVGGKANVDQKEVSESAPQESGALS